MACFYVTELCLGTLSAFLSLLDLTSPPFSSIFAARLATLGILGSPFSKLSPHDLDALLKIGVFVSQFPASSFTIYIPLFEFFEVAW